MSYNNIIKYLFNLKGSEEKGTGYNLDIQNIRTLLDKIGNPEKYISAIHVAGTNGKGGVCAMLSSILKEAGYKVGMYTSPHLVDFKERFQINGKKISKKEFIHYFNKVKKYVTNQTFFEVITALAFFYYKEKNVDYLVLETGLGGRLDATNVVNPLLSVITNINLEHTQLLGKNINKIAFEKAGIIKNNKPVVTGASGSALSVIKKIAKKCNSQLYSVKKYKKINDKFIFNNYNFKLKLQGDYQIENAALAVTAIDVLNEHYNLKIDRYKIKNGLLKTKWPGRFEFIGKRLLVDCAHNPSAALALKNNILKARYKNIILIIGVLKDKDYKKILAILTPLAYKVILTKPSILRAREPEELAEYMETFNKKYEIIKNVRKAIKHAEVISNKDDIILITGSIYVVGEAMTSK